MAISNCSIFYIYLVIQTIQVSKQPRTNAATKYQTASIPKQQEKLGSDPFFAKRSAAKCGSDPDFPTHEAPNSTHPQNGRNNRGQIRFSCSAA